MRRATSSTCSSNHRTARTASARRLLLLLPAEKPADRVGGLLDIVRVFGGFLQALGRVLDDAAHVGREGWVLRRALNPEGDADRLRVERRRHREVQRTLR